MAIRTSGKRKITIDGRIFVWHIQNEFDSAGKIPVVSSTDKKFIVHYRLFRLAEEPKLLRVVGSEFYGQDDKKGPWKIVRCPAWEDSAKITPKSIRNLIEWCFDKTQVRDRAPALPQ